MSHAGTQQRLATLQLASIDPTMISAFEQHMAGYFQPEMPPPPPIFDERSHRTLQLLPRRDPRALWSARCQGAACVVQQLDEGF